MRTPAGELLECRDASHSSDQATRFLLAALPARVTGSACEAGCGTGVLAMTLARLGTSRVWATDVDTKALDLLQRALLENAIDNVVVRKGSLLEPIPSDERLDLVVGLLPQKPAPSKFDLRYAGGSDGTDLLIGLIEQAAVRLARGGKLLFYHHTLAAPARVEAALTKGFAWRVRAQRLRYCAKPAYAALAPGMLARLEQLVAEGTAQAWFSETWIVWRSRILEATRL